MNLAYVIPMGFCLWVVDRSVFVWGVGPLGELSGFDSRHEVGQAFIRQVWLASDVHGHQPPLAPPASRGGTGYTGLLADFV